MIPEPQLSRLIEVGKIAEKQFPDKKEPGYMSFCKRRDAVIETIKLELPHLFLEN